MKNGNVKDTLKYAREKLIRLAKEDPAEFIESAIKIEDKYVNDIVPFKLWAEQKKTVEGFEKNGKIVVLKARQLGFSWLVISYAITKMIAVPGYRVMCFSQGEAEAKEMIRRAGRVIMPNMSFMAGEGGIAGFTAKKEELVIHHTDGRESVIEAKSSSGDSGRSISADLVIFDEWAMHPFAEALFNSAYPTINRPEGKFIGLSTMKRGTFFEDVIVNYDQKGFYRVFIPWSADPRRTQEWYEETRRAMGDMILQEYPASIEEALLIPGGSFFPEVSYASHIVPKMCEEERKKLIYYEAIDYGLDMLSIRWISVDEKGRCRVYREFDCPDLIISEAAREIRRYWNREGKPKAVLAPPDMWNRETGTGKSRFDLFCENGVVLLKASNDLAAGCAALKELLHYDAGIPPRMVFEEGATHRCMYDLTKIQKDKKRADIYAKEPHDLTHGVDALRYFAVSYIKKTPEEREIPPAALHYRQQMKTKRRRMW